MGVRIKSIGDRAGASREFEGESSQPRQDSSERSKTHQTDRLIPTDVTTLSHLDRAQLRSLSLQQQETAESISILQTAANGLEESHDRLMKLKSMAHRLKNTEGTRTPIDAYRQLIREIDAIADSIAYKGHSLFQRDSLPGSHDDQAFRAVDRELQQVDPHARSLGIDRLPLAALGPDEEMIDSALTKLRNYQSYLDVTQQSFSTSLEEIRMQLHAVVAAESSTAATLPAGDPVAIIKVSATTSLSVHNKINPALALSLIP